MAAHKSVTEPKVIFMLVHIWVWQVLNWHIVGRICISKFGDVRLQTGHTPIFVDSNVFGTEYKIQCVWINRTSCFKKRPANLIVFTFWFEHMRRVASHFPKFIPPKVGRNPCFLTFWLGNAFPATTAALFPHPDFRKWSEPVLSHHKNDQFFHWTPKHGPNKTVCFVYFDLDLCFAPKQQVPKLVRERLTCRSAPRHNRIPFCHTRTLKTGPVLLFFPTCQVRVVRFYVSLFSFPTSGRPVLLLPVVLLLVGSQLRSCEFSVACRAPTASSWVQCGVPDPNRDPASSVWRAGPQPWSREFSVACRTPTASSWVQCGVPDPNRDRASSVWRAGPQPRSREFSVACRTSTAIPRVQCGVPDRKYCVRKFVRKNVRRYVRKNVRRHVRRNVRRYVRRNVRKICQKICQKECQKICQKICQKKC